MRQLTDLGASELLEQLREGKTTAVAVMTAFLDRIAAVNPAINAIVALQDREALLAEARAADALPPAARGRLHGLPMAVKDLAAVKGILSTWGSPIHANFIPEKDDMLPARLRAAGAILIGKTNTPEYGLGSHSFNPVHGVTRNPYDLSVTAGGSSGGAAAALAARIAPIADGSDMMGSLRNPAGFCNVYGFRPTYGRVPVEPMGDTFLHQLSTDGPMARNIEDLALLLAVLAEPDPRLPHGRPNEDFRGQLARDIRGAKIGWLGDWGGAYPMEAGILTQSRAALKVFEDLGAEVVELPPPYPAEKIWTSWTTLRSWAIASKLGLLYDAPKTRPLLKDSLVWEIEEGRKHSGTAIHQASVLRSEWNSIAVALLQKVDILVLPTAQVWPFPVEWSWPQEIAGRAMDSYHRWMEVVIPASLLGLPALSAPGGFGDNGLPFGLQFIGARGEDLKVLQFGQAWHQATDWPSQRPPLL